MIFELERRVVLEEISTVDDTPDDLVFELHNAAMWHPHPYGYSILGTRETVSALSVRELRELHDRAYHPPQMVVAAAGHVRHDDLLGALERTGWVAVPRGEERPLAAPCVRAADPVARHVDRDTVQTHIVLGTPTFPHADPRRYALVLLSLVLGGGMSSRLFQRIREERGLAYAVYTFQSFHPDTGVHGVYVGTSPATAREAAAAIVEELGIVAAVGLPEEELEMGKNQLKGQVTLSLESPTSRMYRAATVDLYGAPYRSLDDVLARIDDLTSDDIRAVAAEFLAPERQTLLSLGPPSDA